MTLKRTTMTNSVSNMREVVYQEADRLAPQLKDLGEDIHSHPELGYQEIHAHDAIVHFLESQGFQVKRHAYGLETSFEAEAGSGGRMAVFCAEYDALPGIGHACGHNLIAMASVTAFVAAAKAIVSTDIPGRVRLLGTPAEEGGGGKCKLIEAGAFSDQSITAAIMSHPGVYSGTASGVSGYVSKAAIALGCDFHGKPAHASLQPWGGVNALDAAVASYASISMLRQQIHPEDRIQGIISNGGAQPNIIPSEASVEYAVRSNTAKGAEDLLKRAKCCFEAAAQATGCSLNYRPKINYKNAIPNLPLCKVHSEEMGYLGEQFLVEPDEATGSTDLGNVSHVVPSLHTVWKIPGSTAKNHTAEFTEAAATPEAYDAGIKVGKGMAMLGVRLLMDEEFSKQVHHYFEAVKEV